MQRRDARSGRAGRGPGGRSYERPTAKPAFILKKLWKYMLAYKGLLMLVAAMSVASNLLALVGPTLSGYAIDALKGDAGGVDFPQVFHYARLMLIFYAASSVLSYLIAVLMIRLSRNIVYRMRRDVFNRIATLPVSFFDKYQAGDVMSVISYDVDTVNMSLSNDLVQMLTSIITVGGSAAMMLAISPRLILVFLFTIPISLLFTRYRSRRARALFRTRSQKLGEMNGFVEEMTAGQRTTKAYGREEYMIGRFQEKNDEAVDANYRADYFASVTGPTVSFVNNLSLALVSIFGSLMYMAGGITLGSISSFVLYSRKFSGPINEFANIISDLQSAMAAAERVLRLIDMEPEAPDAADAQALADVLGEVALRKVSFGYEAGQTVLKDISLRAQPGQTIAIVGPTGSGKTTIINLLMRFYDVDSGAITIDGHEIRGLTRASLRSSFSMVLQETWLFYGTIYENIAYGSDRATREDVVRAAKAAHIHNYIVSLPEGYDTLLSDNGVNISKGQKQLLTIARAMLMDSRMLILDEATSNVDTQTERLIQAAMLDLMRGRTCFVIAHRLSTIQNADLILVIQDGALVESGNHEALMRKGGYYRELYNAQFDAA